MQCYFLPFPVPPVCTVMLNTSTLQLSDLFTLSLFLNYGGGILMLHTAMFQVAYTFDAGPNACLFLLENEIAEVLSLIKHYFFPDTDRG